MDSFDTYIARRLPLVSLISTVFIIYPNIACIPWELKYVEGTGVTGFFPFLCIASFSSGINQFADTL